MRHRRWGRPVHKDETIREIAALCKTMPRCNKTDEELARRFHCAASTVRRIACGWLVPKGTTHAQEYRSR